MTDDTRSRILRVALELFASLGYHATSVREIAERLNLTKTAVLYHFPSKKDILATLAEPMLADMEAAVEAAGGIEGADFRRKRWAVIEGLLDVWLRHRFLMRMNTQDLALGADRPTFERFRDTAMMAEHFIAGPDADLAGQVRAVQAFAMLSDPVVMFADLPAELVRPAVLAGVERLLGETAPGCATEFPSDLQAGSAAELRVGSPAGVRRRGRPGAMSPDMIETARRMHATGEHTAADISRALGVSRATVYRHLPED